MKIYLIRHGETTGDIEERFGGDYDDSLTNKGILQAQELAKKLQNKGIEIIFSSPLIRAKQTANQIQKQLKIPIEIIDNLKERNNYGVLTGLTQLEAKEKYPFEIEKISLDKTYHNVTNSESYKEVKKRVINVFHEILLKDYNSVAIISHGGIISTYVREVLTVVDKESFWVKPKLSFSLYSVPKQSLKTLFEHYKQKNIKLGDCAILEIVKDNEKLSLNLLDKADFN